jgi:hypothetical protein
VFLKFSKISGSILIIILSRYIDRDNCCHVTCIMNAWLLTYFQTGSDACVRRVQLAKMSPRGVIHAHIHIK